MTSLRSTVPASRVNDDLCLTPCQWQILLRHQSRFLDMDHRDEMIPESLDDECRSFRVDFLADHFVYVITETLGDFPGIYVTEKTWKAMVAGTPFLMIGPRHTLAWLREQGFRTFDAWWDESYDDLPTVAHRVDAVVRHLQKFSDMPWPELRDLRSQMLPVLEHNQQHVAQVWHRELAKIQALL